MIEGILARFLLFLLHFLSCVHSFNHYTNNWAVKIDGGIEEAKQLAADHGFVYVAEIMPGYYSFKHHSIHKRSLEPSHQHQANLLNNQKVEWAQQQVAKKRTKRDLSLNSFNDPLWPQVWYMHSKAGNDMRVMDVYNKYNITGSGIHVTILDDGLEKDHPDLKNNYDPGSSYDVNGQDNDPQPTYDSTDENRHGTRCAGEVAAEANNGICGVGIAYKAGIGGVRMLDGDVTDAVEAQSLSLNPQHIDIYSVSWGPEDNGMTVDGPGPLARQAFFNGIYKGRNKLGNIFVWASGNGGLKGDSCACDGYTNSIFTLSISSASQNGQVPWYSEPCASTLATTYSSGGMNEQQIITTDIRKRCTTSHTGTSASAPLAAGICALVLEANKQLTWRDMQYIVFLTAREANLNAEDWIVTGVGKKVSHHFGYGLMDATAMVEAALGWIALPDHHKCPSETSREFSSYLIPPSQSLFSIINSTGCQGTMDSVAYLEHVEVVITLDASRRGEVEIYLTSPFGTKSQLLIRRSSDRSDKGFEQWSFMTTHCWGENPSGEWKLEIKNRDTTSSLKEWTLILYGVASKPEVYKKYLDQPSDPVDRNPPNSTISNLCPADQFLFGKVCVTTCPLGFYGSVSEGVCQLCQSGCQECTKADNCIRKRTSVNEKHWYLAVGAICALMAFALLSGILLVICFWRRRGKEFSYNFIDPEQNGNHNNRRQLHRPTYPQINTIADHDQSTDGTKDRLLDPLSSDDETSGPVIVH